MEEFMLFFGTCLALSALPGPNNILCLTHAVEAGRRNAVLGALGRFPAYVMMIVIAAILFASAVTANEGLLGVLQAVGCLYMLYLGSQIVRSGGKAAIPNATPQRGYFVTEFLTALSNPKAIIVFAALFPSFLNSDGSIFMQFALLGAIAMLAEAMMAVFYAFAGGFVRAQNIPARKICMVTGFIVIAMSVWLLYDVVFN